jgi:hypothetical protein
MPNEQDELPPESFLNKLPNSGDNGDLFLSSGWGAVLPQTNELNWDAAGQKAKPEMVISDNEQAKREGFRER